MLLSTWLLYSPYNGENFSKAENMRSTWFTILLLAFAPFSMAQDTVDQKHLTCTHLITSDAFDPIGEVISKSTFIGVYKARLDSYETGPSYNATIDELRFDEDFEARLNGTPPFTAQHTLLLTHTVYGSTLPAFRITAHNDPTKVPGSYFFIDKIHHQMLLDEDISFGRSVVFSKVDEIASRCEVVPELVDGYDYLVFGGIGSSISIEPILDRERDPLYLHVLRRVEKLNRNANQ